jgi:hypothetical protein
MKDLEKEIAVVKNLIRILNECFAIAMSNKRKEEAKSCRRDIALCTQELNRLLSIREQQLNAAAKAAKEPAGDAAV